MESNPSSKSSFLSPVYTHWPDHYVGVANKETRRVTQHLVEESDQLTGAPLVWFWQVEILEVENETVAVLRSVDSAGVAADHHAHLTELLQHVRRRRLCAAVHNCHLRRPLLPETVLKQHAAWQRQQQQQISSCNRRSFPVAASVI